MPQTQRLHEELPPTSSLGGHEQDLWRLIHSQAYRALASKSCFPALLPDKTAPSILLLATKAAHFSRTLASRLSLKVHLTESLLVARFLGYPAGGEFAIRLLSRFMQQFGGFSLTDQSLRIIDDLEMVFPEFNGLNLAWEIRRSLGATPPNQYPKGFRETAIDLPEHGVVAFATRLSMLELDLLHFPTDLRDAALEHCGLWGNIKSSISSTYPQLESKRLFAYTLQQFLLRLLDEASLVTGHLLVTLSPSSDSSLQDLEHSLHQERKKGASTLPGCPGAGERLYLPLPTSRHPTATDPRKTSSSY